MRKVKDNNIKMETLFIQVIIILEKFTFVATYKLSLKFQSVHFSLNIYI